MTPTSNQSSTIKSLKHPVEEASDAPKSNAKKARLDVGNAAGRRDVTEPSDDEPNNVKKHSGKLYYEDGNVVLISEKVAFRVHRMFLASRSEVFKDVFELGTHPKDGECFDGCPAIHLDDEVDDLTAFLEAFYGHTDLKDIENNFPKFSAVLRLSTKYMVDTLRSSCLSQLSLAKVPQTRDAYDRHCYEEVHAGFFGGYLKLVYDVGAICLLPSVFYILSTFIIPDIDETDFPLTADVMLRLYHGRTKLFEIYARNIHGLKEETADCSKCQRAKRSFFKEMASQLTQPSILVDFDPLNLCLLKIYQSADDLCGSCRLNTKRQLKCCRQKIWDALPEIFDFGGSWSALKDDMSVWSTQNQLK